MPRSQLADIENHRAGSKFLRGAAREPGRGFDLPRLEDRKHLVLARAKSAHACLPTGWRPSSTVGISSDKVGWIGTSIPIPHRGSRKCLRAEDAGIADQDVDRWTRSDVTGHIAYINMHDLALEVGDSLLGTTLGAPVQDDD